MINQLEKSIYMVAGVLAKPELLLYLKSINLLEICEREVDSTLNSVALLLEVLKRNYLQHSELPRLETTVKHHIEALITKYELVDIDQSALNKIITKAFSIHKSLQRDSGALEAIENLLDEFIATNYFNPLVQSVVADSSDTKHILRNLTGIVDKLESVNRGDEPEEIMLGQILNKTVNKMEGFPSGVPAVDELLPTEGLRRTSTTAITAPTSGGKSLLVLQLGASLASQGYHVVHGSLEEQVMNKVNPIDPDSPMSSDWAFRVVASEAGLSMQDTKQYNTFDEWPEDMKQRVMNLQKKIGENWRIIDFTTHGFECQSFNYIANRVRSIHEKKRPVDCLILDPFYPCVGATLAAEGSSPDQHAIRNAAYELTKKLNSLARELGCVLFITHQMDATSAQIKAPSNISPYVLGEAKNIAWELPSILAITPPHDSKGELCWLVLAKGRNEGKKGNSVKVRLNGAMNRLDLATEEDELEGELSKDFTSLDEIYGGKE